MRKNLRRYRRKLESHGRVSIEIKKGQSASAEFLEEFLALEASGWKGRHGTAIMNNSNSTAFHSVLVGNFAAQGRLEWYILRVDGRLVAARMGIQCGRALMMPKIAFNEDFAECRPGSLLAAEAIKDAFSRPEIDEINFMSNSEAHRFWHLPQDEYTNVHLVRRSALSMVFQFSRIMMRSIYRDHVRSRIPEVMKTAHRQFQRRGDRKPRRAVHMRSTPSDAPGND
jgi:Acetyltransferase (GNAT) domain